MPATHKLSNIIKLTRWLPNKHSVIFLALTFFPAHKNHNAMERNTSVGLCVYTIKPIVSVIAIKNIIRGSSAISKIIFNTSNALIILIKAI